MNRSVQSQFWSTSGCGLDVDKTLEMDNAKQLMEVQRRKVKRTEVNCQGKWGRERLLHAVWIR